MKIHGFSTVTVVSANDQEVHQTALALQSASDFFLANPSATPQDAAQKA